LIGLCMLVVVPSKAQSPDPFRSASPSTADPFRSAPAVRSAPAAAKPVLRSQPPRRESEPPQEPIVAVPQPIVALPPGPEAKAGRPIDGHYTMGRPDGTEFRGYLVNGWASGQGRYVRNGRVYEGNWKEGCFEEGGRWAWFSATETDSDCIRRLKQKK